MPIRANPDIGLRRSRARPCEPPRSDHEITSAVWATTHCYATNSRLANRRRCVRGPRCSCLYSPYRFRLEVAGFEPASRKPSPGNAYVTPIYKWQVAVPPILFYPSSVSSPEGWPRLPIGGVAATGHGSRLNRSPCPPALLPVGHSPSRRCHQRRWWALTPPFQPSPRGYPRGGSIFCCSCRHPCGCPELLFPQATLLSNESRESGSSSGGTVSRVSSDGPLACHKKGRMGLEPMTRCLKGSCSTD